MGTTNNTSPAYSKGKGFFNKFSVPLSSLIVLNDVAAAGSVALPANTVVRRVIVNNKTANAITGGLKVGTAAAGTQVLAAGAVAASVIAQYPAIEIPVVPQVAGTLFYDAVTGWNGANIDLVFELAAFPNT